MKASPPDFDPRDDWTQGGTRLHYQSCPACGHRWYFRRAACPHCGGESLSIAASDGLGVVVAITWVHRAPDDAFRALVPYGIALVDLDEGVRVMAHAGLETAIGDRVICAGEAVAGRVLPVARRG